MSCRALVALRCAPCVGVLLAGVSLARSQSAASRPPQFQDYPAVVKFHRHPKPPVLDSPEKQKYEQLIEDGVLKGWGVFDGVTEEEFQRAGQNFAGHYILVNFGLGDSYSDCVGAAIVDANSGKVFNFPPPHECGGDLGFLARFLPPHPTASFHGYAFRSPIAYRLTSRLLVVDTCDGSHMEEFGSVTTAVADGCGAHYYVMDENGLRLIAQARSQGLPER